MATKGGTGLTLKRDRLPELEKLMLQLSSVEVLVGFPEDSAARKEDAGITNAALGYIHDNGAPEQNIPARPFMIPGIESESEALADTLASVARTVLKTEDAAAIERGYHRLGLKAQLAIRRKINEGIAPPLSDRTLRERARRGKKGRKGAKLELELRAAGWTPSTDFAKPLVDTAQMRNAVNYAIRQRSARRR